MTDPDLNFIRRHFDTLQQDLREGLRTMELRDQQREAGYQSMIQTLTRQIVQVVTEVDTRLSNTDERLTAMEAQLTSALTLLADIARKLDA